MEAKDGKTIENALYVVATPIGNLEDITLRAIRILSEVDLIACENPLNTLKLLNHIGIKNKLYSYNQHSSTRTTKTILNKLKEGLSIALVTDRGTPCISDPGSRLVSYVQENGYKAVPIPGPCAATALLSVCGLPLHNFIFVGFLSPKSGRRAKRLSELKSFQGNIIIYESPRKINKLILEIRSHFPNKEIVIGRELTKTFEELIKIPADKTININVKEKGEYTVIINNSNKRKDLSLQ